jgi:hypothetical protein
MLVQELVVGMVNLAYIWLGSSADIFSCEERHARHTFKGAVVIGEDAPKRVMFEVTWVRGTDDSVQFAWCAIANEVHTSLGLGGCRLRAGSSSRNNCWMGSRPTVKEILYLLGCRGTIVRWLGDPGAGVVTWRAWVLRANEVG